MANQITHIILAERMSDKLFNKFDRKSFLIGTVFPDIRYLKVIDRDKTHFKELTFEDILNESNSFTAGLKYHSLVDEVREKYMVDNNVYSLIPESKFVVEALKTYEDEILYSKITDWNQVKTYLDDVLQDETQLVSHVDKIKMWQSLMQEYFKDIPSDTSRKNFILGVGFNESIAAELNATIAKMRLIPEIREIILNLYTQWDSLLFQNK